VAGFSERVLKSLAKIDQMLSKLLIGNPLKISRWMSQVQFSGKKIKTGELFISFFYIACIYIQADIYTRVDNVNHDEKW
jgi:hypothetical protein